MGESAVCVGDGGRVKKYQFYGKDKNGTMLPLFEGVWETAPNRAQVDVIYAELSRQMALQGQPIGAVPRPTHYAVLLELHEIEEGGEAPVMLHSANGQTVN
mgnify:CR=1 FL=1